jgi:nucleoside-diphosphate-sugar epimerase
MNIFVTGGTGFVGSNFIDKVLSEGHSVVALKRLGSEPKVFVKIQPLWIEGSLEICQPGLFKDVDVFVHLAAHSANPPYDSLENCLYWNVLAPIKLASQAAAEGVNNFVIAGSCFEYGSSAVSGMLSVTSPLEPNLSYPTSKAAASIAFKGMCRDLNIKLRMLRFFHVFGEGEPSTRFWPSLKKAALAGDDFDMSAGAQIRDFVNVSHVAKALTKALDFSSIKSGEPDVSHVATGNPKSLMDFANEQWKFFNASGKLNAGSVLLRRNEINQIISNPSDIFQV